MFERPHHQRIDKILGSLNSELLNQCQCYFGGGTAIVLSLGEYRESVDIGFLCSSNDGYRELRNIISQNSLGIILNQPIKHLRDVRADRYGIRTILEVDGAPIKIEIVSEGRIKINGDIHPEFHVPTLSREDMYAEKLLANADRGLDRSTMSRDIIDLAMMIDGWGGIPDAAWEKAKSAYGNQVIHAFDSSKKMISDKQYLTDCLNKMSVNEMIVDSIYNSLNIEVTDIKDKWWHEM